MDAILINPAVKRWTITHVLLNTNVWSKEKADEYVKDRYRYYEYLGTTGGYHQYRVIPKTELEELEKEAKKIRGGKDIYRMLTFGPPEHGVRVLAVLAIPPREKEKIKTTETEKSEEVELLENPVKKITPEIEKAVVEFKNKNYKISQIKALIKEKFGIEISATSIRNILKKYGVISGVEDEEKEEGGEDMGALPSGLMKEARAKFKSGEFSSLSEALKWAWKKYRESATSGPPTRVVSEVLINKAKKVKKTGGVNMAKAKMKTKSVGESSIRRLTKAINELNEAISARKKRKRKATTKLPKPILPPLPPLPPISEPISEWKPFKTGMREVIAPIVKEHEKFYHTLGEELKKAWSTPEGTAFRDVLRKELKKVWGTEALSEEEIETLAIEELAEAIGQEEEKKWKPFTREMGLREAIKSAWEGATGVRFKPVLRAHAGMALKAAWLTPEGQAFREVLSRAVKAARAKVYREEATITELEALDEIAEAIEQVYPKGYTPPVYSEEFKKALRSAVKGAWASEAGGKFYPILRKALIDVWSTPEGQIVKEKLSEAIKAKKAEWYPPEETRAITEALATLGAFESVGEIDVISLFGIDWLIPGGLGIFAESWAGWGIRKLAKLPFGADADKVTWKKILYNLLAGAVHYAGINYVFNTFLKGNAFFNKVRVAYTMSIYRDIMEALFGNLLPTPNAERIRELEAELKKGAAKPTGEVENVGQGDFVVDLDRLEVDEEGNLVVPKEYYEELMSQGTLIIETPPGFESTDKVEEEYEELAEEAMKGEEIVIESPEEKEEIEIQGVEE